VISNPVRFARQADRIGSTSAQRALDRSVRYRRREVVIRPPYQANVHNGGRRSRLVRPCLYQIITKRDEIPSHGHRPRREPRRSRACRSRGLKITIESFHYQIRKIIKNRGQFLTNDAVVKLVWLAIVDIEDQRARAREKDRGKPANARTAPGRLIEGHATQGWRQAINALSTVFDGLISNTRSRLNPRSAVTSTRFARYST
jgi:hypothetical protein